MKKVLITDKVHPHLVESLRARDYFVDYIPNINYKEFLAVVVNYYGVVINSKIKMNKEAIDKAHRLSFIARLGSGLDIIDLVHANTKRIDVYSSPEGNRNAVAEHAVGMLLSLCNNLLRADRELRRLEWNREANRGMEMEGKTIGIIGFGNNGTEFAKKWQNWNVKILAYDKYKKDYTKDFSWVQESNIEEIQEKADIISLHIPLTEETHHLINDDFIKNCQKSFILINCARGKNIATKDLINGLNSGKIKGACLDVFENEKPQTFTISEQNLYNQLYAMENVVLSPHIAGWTFSSFYKIAASLSTQILGNQ